MLGRFRQTHETINLVADVAEAASLAAIAVYGQVLPAKRLSHEVGNHASIVELHAWPVGVENPRDAGVQVVIAVVSHGHGFAEALGFIVNRTRTDGIHVSPVSFFLRMLQGIAVALRSR